MTYKGKRICRGCGCTDDRACISFGEACAWVLLDIALPTGLCSFCAEDCEWDFDVMATQGWRGQPRQYRNP